MNDLKKKVAKLSVLLDVSKAINTLTDIRSLLTEIVNGAVTVAEADRGSIFLIEGQELWTISGTGLGQNEIRLPLSNNSIAGSVGISGETLNLADAYTDSRFNPAVDKSLGKRTKSLLTVPIRDRQGKISGVLQVLNYKDAQFSPMDVELLEAFAQQAAVAIENSQLYSQQQFLHNELKLTFNSLTEALATTIDAKHHLTSGHTHRVTQYALMLGQVLGLSNEELETLKVAGMLHDIGKIGIPDAVLAKPGKLTDEEYKIIQTHAYHTRVILDKIYFPAHQKDVPLIASSHHEKVDGTGYPQKLKDQEIPFMAKILAVADVFDAITSKRDYREPMPKDEAFGIIRKGSGNHFDPVVVEALEKLYDQVPLPQ